MTYGEKIYTPLKETEFHEGLEHGKFTQKNHRGFAVLLFYSGVRVTEALRSKKEQFKILEDKILFDVGPRLKHGLHTPPLPILLDKPYVNDLLWSIKKAKDKKRVFPYCRKTGYNIISRVWHYPHHLRLTKITNLLNQGFSLIQVRSWSGHARIESLNPYAGIVDIEKMGKA